MPVGDVLVGDAGGDIKHDDAALAVDVVTVTETTKLLLARSVPHVELDLAIVLQHCLAPGLSRFANAYSAEATYGGEGERVDLDTEGGHVLLLELASQMALDEGGLHRTMSAPLRSVGVHSRPRSRHRGREINYHQR